MCVPTILDNSRVLRTAHVVSPKVPQCSLSVRAQPSCIPKPPPSNPSASCLQLKRRCAMCMQRTHASNREVPCSKARRRLLRRARRNSTQANPAGLGRLVRSAPPPGAFESPPPGGKAVYLIRHGESAANVAPRGAAHSLKDARLTDLGRRQASELQEAVAQWGCEAVFVSPLTRALHTACLAFEEQPIPMVVLPELTESWPERSQNTGRTKQMILDDPELMRLKRFSTLTWENMSLDGPWWEVCNRVVRRLMN